MSRGHDHPHSPYIRKLHGAMKFKFREACIHCPMLHIDPRMILRLNDIEIDLEQRRQRAHDEGWLGEIEGIDLTLTFLHSKRDEASRLFNRTALGTPEFPTR